MRTLLLTYKSFIKANILGSPNDKDWDLRHWQDQLFCNFLIYCVPISLIALFPGVFMALKEELVAIASIDLISFALIAGVAFVPNIKIRHRKIAVIVVFYILAVFLINKLGYLGPGVFYLFFVTVLSALIFPIRYAYLSIVFNAAVLLAFASIISLKLFNSALIIEYNTGAWIAFSSNLIFASVVIVLLIDKIFGGLQHTITKKTLLQERYSQTFYKSPLPMWLFDTDTFRFISVNDAAITHYGYTKQEFLNMTIMDIRPVSDVMQTEELVRANKLSGRYYGGVSQHICKNGEMIYVNIESNLLNIEGRQVRLVQAADITMQLEHQLEVFDVNQKVKESEANLRAIFDNTIDGFVLLDADFKIKLFNTKALDSMKFNKNQSPFQIGQSIFNYVDSSRLANFREFINKVYNGGTVDYDRPFRNSGMISWIRYTLTPVWEATTVIGACITGRDVTARKLYLRSIEEQNRVFREIAWTQSHLVRAPLARIMGLIPMLQNTNQEGIEEVIDYITKSANELDDIIKDITVKSTKIIEKYCEPMSGE